MYRERMVSLAGPRAPSCSGRVTSAVLNAGVGATSLGAVMRDRFVFCSRRPRHPSLRSRNPSAPLPDRP